VYEYQDYGLMLVQELGDKNHKTLNIRLARDKDRQLLERIRTFVKDADDRSPARLFMWKLSHLEKNHQRPTRPSYPIPSIPSSYRPEPTPPSMLRSSLAAFIAPLAT